MLASPVGNFKLSVFTLHGGSINKGHYSGNFVIVSVMWNVSLIVLIANWAF